MRNPKHLLWSLLACAGAATVSVRAQDVVQPKPGTVVVEHGDDRITIEFDAVGKPVVSVNGRAVAADPAAKLKNTYGYALQDFYLRVTPSMGGQSSVIALPPGQARNGLSVLLNAQQAVKRSHIGVQVGGLTEALADQLELDAARCVLVLSVTADGPAAKAGLQANDILLRVGDHDVVTSTVLGDVVARSNPGDQLEVVFLRRGLRETRVITVAAEVIDPRRLLQGKRLLESGEFVAGKHALFGLEPWSGAPSLPGAVELLQAQGAPGRDEAQRARVEQDLAFLLAEVKRLNAEWARLREQLERDAAAQGADKRDR